MGNYGQISMQINKLVRHIKKYLLIVYVLKMLLKCNRDLQKKKIPHKQFDHRYTRQNVENMIVVRHNIYLNT